MIRYRKRKGGAAAGAGSVSKLKTPSNRKCRARYRSNSCRTKQK